MAIGRIAVVQADPPGRPIRGLSWDSLPSLRHDLAGGIQQFVQVVDRTHQSAMTSTRGRVVLTASAQFGRFGLRTAHRPLGVDQQPPGVAYVSRTALSLPVHLHGLVEPVLNQSEHRLDVLGVAEGVV
uniref:hypothetical protein n=1 Tax=Mycobacterium simiae TaxID=1784 RepID=UPI00358E2C62